MIATLSNLVPASIKRRMPKTRKAILLFVAVYIAQDLLVGISLGVAMYAKGVFN